MRRSFSVVVLSALLAVLAPAVSAAGATCGADLGQRLRCWSRWIDEGTVHVTLDRAVPFDGSADDRRDVERTLWDGRENLVVEVPTGGHTGPGGTALLLLADRKTRLVAKDATIDRLTPGAVAELADLRACHPENAKDPCALLGKGSLSGAAFIAQDQAADLTRHTYAVADSADPPAATPSRTTGTAKGEQGAQKGRNGGDSGSAGGSGSDTGWDTTTGILAVLCAVLVVLLGALLLLVRRSSHAVGTLSRRALAAPGVGAVQAAAASPPPRAADERTTRIRTPDERTTRTRAPDESTTRLRVAAPAHRYRRVGNVPGPARSAVVRTELHPQGYVELDHVLHRAVWAEPGRPPPAPGALVDVTDARDQDSDVLYAFPPTTGRHARP
ncbi:hypothetical protein [Streptomyces sp. NPDC048643]|uniref:hypothetical protein n=1 Tax=Streptomyces sp. NPDC048643 TaxID=3155637 RepID=UPI00343D0FD4